VWSKAAEAVSIQRGRMRPRASVGALQDAAMDRKQTQIAHKSGKQKKNISGINMKKECYSELKMLVLENQID